MSSNDGPPRLKGDIVAVSQVGWKYLDLTNREGKRLMFAIVAEDEVYSPGYCILSSADVLTVCDHVTLTHTPIPDLAVERLRYEAERAQSDAKASRQQRDIGAEAET